MVSNKPLDLRDLQRFRVAGAVARRLTANWQREAGKGEVVPCEGAHRLGFLVDPLGFAATDSCSSSTVAAFSSCCTTSSRACTVDFSLFAASDCSSSAPASSPSPASAA